MNANVSFRHMESSSALREYAVNKLERIVGKYVRGNVDALVVMSVEKYWHIANFTLNIKNLTVKGKQRSEDMYSSIDLALEKIEKQLRRHKDRIQDHQPANGEGKPFRMGVLSALEPDSEVLYEDSEFEEFEEDYARYPAPDEEEELEVPTNGEAPAAVVDRGDGDEEVKVLRNEEYEAKAMEIEQAALQLHLLDDREFFVFTNSDSGRINIVYKRDDGNVGLIET